MARLPPYVEQAMTQAEYERLSNESWYAHIPGFSGLWASGPNIEDARADLFEALGERLALNELIGKLPKPGAWPSALRFG